MREIRGGGIREWEKGERRAEEGKMLRNKNDKGERREGMEKGGIRGGGRRERPK